VNDEWKPDALVFGDDDPAARGAELIDQPVMADCERSLRREA
jgi:hypothetical protein